jgi:hypothetical protein
MMSARFVDELDPDCQVCGYADLKCGPDCLHGEEWVKAGEGESAVRKFRYVEFRPPNAERWYGEFLVGAMEQGDVLQGDLTASDCDHSAAGGCNQCEHIETFADSPLVLVYLNGHLYWVDGMEKSVLSVGHIPCDDTYDEVSSVRAPVFMRKHRLVFRDREVLGIKVYKPGSTLEVSAGVGCCPECIGYDDDWVFYVGCDDGMCKLNLDTLEGVWLGKYDPKFFSHLQIKGVPPAGIAPVVRNRNNLEGSFVAWGNIVRCSDCGAGCPEESLTCIRCGSTKIQRN